MAVNVAKIHLGAPSLVQLGTQDMGATKGGVILKYTPKEMLIECDQYLAPVAVFRTQEEATIEMAFYETQMVKVNYAFGLNGVNAIVTTSGSPNTDKLNFGGNVQIGTSTMDLTIPKNDGTSNNYLVHLNKVHSYKEISLPFSRDKDTEYKSVFNALADTTQPVGQQLGYFLEQY